GATMIAENTPIRSRIAYLSSARLVRMFTTACTTADRRISARAIVIVSGEATFRSEPRYHIHGLCEQKTGMDGPHDERRNEDRSQGRTSGSHRTLWRGRARPHG